jgi:TRAP-type C4-dicarboxylate transport system permease small subunit
VKKLRPAVRILLALLGILIGWTAASYAFIYFTQNGMTSDVATGCSIVVFLAVLVAFGFIAFKVKL